MIQRFLDKQIVKEVREGDSVFYFGQDEELLAESEYDEDQLASITFHEPAAHPFTTGEERQALIKKVQTAFQKEHLTSDVIIDLDTHYLAQLTVTEPRYHLPVHSTGMNVTIGYDGTIETIVFLNEEVSFQYPKQLISKEAARDIIKQQPLVSLTIHPDIGWHYVYAPDHNLFGVLADGTLSYAMDMPEMAGVGYEPLPKVEAAADLQAFLLAGRVATFEFFNEDNTNIWEVYSEQEETAGTGDPFEKACIALKTILGDKYEAFYYENTDALYVALGLVDDEDVFKSYRFVYIQDGIAFDFLATTITVNTETNHIQSIVHNLIPYEKLQNLKPPIITLEEATTIAQGLVDVQLTLSREGMDSTHYTFDYMIDYPTSPTKGNLHYIDAWTGAVHFVETGFQ